jgi:hypothetical protein
LLPASLLKWKGRKFRQGFAMGISTRHLAGSVLAGLGLAVAAAEPPAGDAGGLQRKYGELREELERSPFGRPLHLDSSEGEGTLRGDVHARVRHPFPKVRDSLAEAGQWCDVLTLPFNVQKCEARGDAVSVYIGRKPDAPLEEATRLDLRFTVLAQSDGLLRVQLAAPTGPAGTRDYRIVFEAVPIAAGGTFVHLGYGYGHGVLSRMAIQAYLATSGADKVGFSVAGRDGEGNPRLIGGMRGILERNTMRYFLAIDAFLDSLDAPDASRHRVRLEKWFKAVDRYPRQLREMSLERYLALKE